MNEEPYSDSDEIEEMPDESAIDILDVLEHIQQQLTFLEKKVDTLLSRSEGDRQFNGPRPERKPFRKTYDNPRKSYDGPSQRFDRPPRHSRNDGEDRERGYMDRESSRDNHYDRRKPGKKPGGKPAGKPRSTSGKKPFYSRYRD